MEMVFSSGSTSWRLSSTEGSHFFFEPVEFDFELADLLVELSLQFLVIEVRFGPISGECGRQRIKKDLLPLSNQIRMNREMSGNFVNGFMTFQSLQSDFGFELCAVALSLRFHKFLLLKCILPAAIPP